MVVIFKEPKLVGIEHTSTINAEDATLIAVENIQCVQIKMKWFKWDLVFPLQDILRFDVN